MISPTNQLRCNLCPLQISFNEIHVVVYEDGENNPPVFYHVECFYEIYTDESIAKNN